MQEHLYSAKAIQILRKSFSTWLVILLQIIINIVIFTRAAVLSTGSEILLFIFLNAFLGLITIPGLLLFFNYRKYTINKTLIVTYNSVKLVDDLSKQVIEINSSEIVEIRLVKAQILTKMPWAFHSYFSLRDHKNNIIVVPFYLIDITEIWLDILARRISSNKLISEVKFYPRIKSAALAQ